jgi:hypothetical protein
MDEETREYIRIMEELFGTQGFKQLVKDAEEAIEVRKDRLLQCNSIDEVRFIQGEVTQLRVITVMEQLFENHVTNALAALEEPDDTVIVDN